MNAKSEYRPDYLIDMLLEKANMRCDTDLAKALDVDPSLISKIRHKRDRISATLLLKMHDVFGHDIQTLREWAGLQGWRKA